MVTFVSLCGAFSLSGMSLDCSGCLRFRLLTKGVLTAGSFRVLFGFGMLVWPMCRVGSGLAGVGTPSTKCMEQILSLGDDFHRSPFLWCDSCLPYLTVRVIASVRFTHRSHASLTSSTFWEHHHGVWWRTNTSSPSLMTVVYWACFLAPILKF